jgi:hypothetical protein
LSVSSLMSLWVIFFHPVLTHVLPIYDNTLLIYYLMNIFAIHSLYFVNFHAIFDICQEYHCSKLYVYSTSIAQSGFVLAVIVSSSLLSLLFLFLLLQENYPCATLLRSEFVKIFKN